MAAVWELAGLALLAGVSVVVGYFVLTSYRIPPARQERARRLALNRRGRVGDGMILEVYDRRIYYTYAINGVSYTTSQDISGLDEFLPDRPEQMVGPVWLKYSTQNPANSIVVCEQWSGIRRTSTKEIVS